MEYASGGELFDQICTAGRFSEAEARYFFQQLICGVDYCHSLQICHRDLKLENTLLDGSTAPLLKICHFGYSKLQKMENEAEVRRVRAELFQKSLIKKSTLKNITSAEASDVPAKSKRSELEAALEANQRSTSRKLFLEGTKALSTHHSSFDKEKPGSFHGKDDMEISLQRL